MTMTSKDKNKAVAIIPSAGLATRLGGKKKNLLSVDGSPVIAHTLRAFEEAGSVAEVILVVGAEDIELFRKEVVRAGGFGKVTAIVAGGKERQDSVAEGLKACKDKGCDVVVVHDGARPMVTADIINRCVEAAIDCGAATTAVAVKDTIKEGKDGVVVKTVPREALYSVQTPQAFRAEVLIEAHEKAAADGFIGTDESSLVERLGREVRLVPGSYENIKVTTEEDLVVCEAYLSRRGR